MLGDISPRQKVTVMIGVLAALLLSALDQTIISTAMPQIVRDLNGLSHLSWVFTGYLLAATIATPIYGKLSDIYGRKSFFMSAVVIFLVGSALAGQSQSMTQLIFFRTLQGIGGGGIMANAYAIIGDLFTPKERGKWQGILGAVFGLASVVGPLLGGYLTDQASWRWTFYINLPIGIAALFLIGILMPRIIPSNQNRRIDYLGAITLAIGLSSLLLGFVWGGSQYAWNSWQVLAAFGSALVVLSIFAFIERAAKDSAILPLDLFQNPIFAVAGFATFLSGMAMFGAIIYIPLFGQSILGTTATSAGAILTPLMFGLITASIIGGQIISRTGHYKLLGIFGLAVVTSALYLLSQMTAETTKLQLVERMVGMGFGLGSTLPVFNIAIQNAFDRTRLGVVTAASQMFRSIGGTVGTAVMGGVLNSALAQHAAILSSDPFAVRLHSLSIGQINFETINSSTVQTLLSLPVQAMIQDKLGQLPPLYRVEALQQFDNFILAIKDAYATSIGEVFLVATALTALAFVVTLFLKEIPLQGRAPVAAELPEHQETLIGAVVEVAHNLNQQIPAVRRPRMDGITARH